MDELVHSSEHASTSQSTTSWTLKDTFFYTQLQADDIMYGSKWIRIGAICGAIGVSFGALGAHAINTSLQNKVDAGDMTNEVMDKVLENWSTATEYMMYHAIAIVLVGLVSVQVCSKLLTCAGSFFTAGIVGFSCGLLIYNIVLMTTGTKIIILVAAAVPLGGVCYIVGWLCLAASLWTGKTCTSGDTEATNATSS